ncbi:hypothetical protein CEP51_002854 [Fusarium floridanum]|uniref:ASST-domain-containing protein n=1 Tax=Fusarium floridanum TaxID=1325733 RepID=A0A428S9K1_9HYPO|nr:hypothetical protein CEP51_002854 [Fusarium floridanum]
MSPMSLPFQLMLALVLALQGIFPSASASSLITQSNDERSVSWFDWGWYGAYPHRNYESFGAQSPWPLVVKTDERCDNGYIFAEPRGFYVDTPGPVVLDNDGNLVWMETRWGEAMDVKVQRFNGKDYITFWHGTDNGTFGEGYYLMLDESYEVFKKVVPIGDFTGDLHEFRITEEGTALMTIYNRKPADLSAYGIPDGWIFDSIFQEIDLNTDELIFEWHASDHFPISDTLAPINGQGKTAKNAFDFFHINSVDKDESGDYIISSRYYCNVADINGKDGSVLWQLGGANSSFGDLSDGAASNFTWNHHAAWQGKNNLTVFDNGSNGHQNSAKYSRGLMINLDIDAMTVSLEQEYISPQKMLSPSQGSVQVLPNGNVLIGWGHVPSFTEFSREGEVLCDTHIGPINFDVCSWVKNYRTFKYPWVGRPKTLPDVAMRPKKNALFVSWNGATEVYSWLLQSASDALSDEFRDLGFTVKTAFEMMMSIPKDADEFIRVAALDRDGNVLAYSTPVSKNEYTVTRLLDAPVRGSRMEPLHILCLSMIGAAIGVCIVFFFRFTIHRGINRVLRRAAPFKYQVLPMHS